MHLPIGILTLIATILCAGSAQPDSGSISEFERTRVLRAASEALTCAPVSITHHRAILSEGGPHDFYSNGDYWWPDPQKPDGLPYIRRDGRSNPDNFTAHRMAVRNLRDAVAALGAAYQLTPDDRYAAKAAALLEVFFLDEATRMEPHLQFAQAIPGVSAGRATGIIDGLHLIEIPAAVEALKGSPAFSREVTDRLRRWFGRLGDWIRTSRNGQEELRAANNHAVACWLQLAVCARFAGHEETVDACRRQFRDVLVPDQMAKNGSFPRELARTKPYGYSIFQLENLAALCQVLSTPDNNLWALELPDGRGIRRAMEFLVPSIADRDTWPLPPDVEAWDGWPARPSCLLFAGIALDRPEWVALWRNLKPDPDDPEVRRNLAITQPILWLTPPDPLQRP